MWVSGGNFNLGKCFYFAFHPVIHFKSNSVKYKTITNSYGLSVQNPADGKKTLLQGLNPNDARRTLRVIMSPDGTSTTQLKATIKRRKNSLVHF
jgi:hypothetical protein